MTTPPTQQGAGRLDLALVERGLARSRGVARELIDDGRVRVGGIPAGKASLQVGADDEVTVIDPGPVWVGRGAEKLAHRNRGCRRGLNPPDSSSARAM